MRAWCAFLAFALVVATAAAQHELNYSIPTHNPRANGFISAVADVNGDTIPDFILSGQIWSTELSANQGWIETWLGKGDGGFEPGFLQPGMLSTYAMATGDFDEDGIRDVAVAGGSPEVEPRTLLVVRGAESGPLQETWSTTAGVTASGLSAGDMNGDGHLDLVTSQIGTAVPSVVVHLGQGDGTFPVRIVSESSSSSSLVDVADYDGDGLLDVLALVAGPPARLVLMRGVGNGLLHDDVAASPLEFQPWSRPLPGDVDGDGRRDVFVRQFPPLLLINSGDGTFASVPVSTTAIPWGTSGARGLHDLNGDGRADLVVDSSNQFQPHLRGTSIWWSDPGGGFVPDQDSFMAAALWEMLPHFADLDCDGATDMVAVGSGVAPTTIMGSRSGGLRRETYYDLAHPSGFEPTTATSVNDVVLADMDLDGTADMVVANRRVMPFPQGSLITVVRGAPYTGPESENWSTLVTGNPTRIAVGRLNGDEWPDVVLVDPNLEKLKQLNGLGNGVLNSPIVREVDGIPVDVALADMDGDLDLDIIYVTENPNAITVLRNDGANVFVPIDSESQSQRLNGLQIRDMNADGHPDVVVHRMNEWAILLFIGSSDGTLTAAGPLHVFPSGTFTFEDVDGDGHLDYLSSLYFSSRIQFGEGPLQFGPITELPVAGPTSFAVGDLDGDGRRDIAASYGFGGFTSSPVVAVLMSRGHRTFARPAYYLSSSSPHPIRAGDIDGNGIDDLVVGGSVLGLLFDLPDRRWNNLGHPLPIAPHLPHLCGAPGDGNPFTIGYELTDAPPLARTSLFLSPRRGDTPLHGGTLVPTPALVLDVGATSADGRLALDLPLLPGLPPGVDLYAQAWLHSAGTFAASNALVTTLP